MFKGNKKKKKERAAPWAERTNFTSSTSGKLRDTDSLRTEGNTVFLHQEKTWSVNRRGEIHGWVERNVVFLFFVYVLFYFNRKESWARACDSTLSTSNMIHGQCTKDSVVKRNWPLCCDGHLDLQIMKKLSLKSTINIHCFNYCFYSSSEHELNLINW